MGVTGGDVPEHDHIVDTGKSSFGLDELGHIQPGLARIMPEIGARIWKCYYAGKAGNHPLARFDGSPADSSRAGRQKRTRSASAPPSPAMAVVAKPDHPSTHENLNALSRDHSPGPSAPSASPSTVNTITYSHPSVGRLNTKKPAFLWLVTHATAATPVTAAAPSGVSRPNTRAGPAASSVTVTSQAWAGPGWRPRLANQVE